MKARIRTSNDRTDQKVRPLSLGEFRDRLERYLRSLRPKKVMSMPDVEHVLHVSRLFAEISGIRKESQFHAVLQNPAHRKTAVKLLSRWIAEDKS